MSALAASTSRRGPSAGLVLLTLALAAARAAAAIGPDVVLVTLDTTRADHLGCYGATAARTPTLDALAARGVRYARALTASPLTLPAHATLLTGLEPPRHGLRDNGLAALPEGLPTLSEVFAAAGYATAAVVGSAVLDHRFGLDRGFAVYDDALTAELRGEYGYPERDAVAVTDAALAWAADRDGVSPWFLWVHYYDPHSPYLDHGLGVDAPLADRYAAEIAHTDAQIGRLLAGLPGDAERRLVAVVGDHGEMLGEHGERAHGLLLYRASLEVPLILAGPGIEPGRVVESTVATRGLGGTLLGLAGLAAPGGLAPGLPELLGLPESDDAVEPERPVYSETWLPATAYGWSPMLAVSRGDWRYVQAPRPELFDFAQDPAESRNLVTERPEIVAELRAALASFAPATPTTAESPPDAAEFQERLRALGYLSGMTGTDAGSIDPKDGIAWLDELEEAKALMASGSMWEARAALDSLVRRNPDNVPFLMRAAEAQLATGDVHRGIDLLERALAINPRLDLLHLRVGDVRAALGDGAGAETAYRMALELNPRLAGAWLGLAQGAALAGRRDEERRLLDTAVEAGTLSAAIFTRLGQLALEAGELAAAEERLARATSLLPSLAPAWWSWGQAAERAGEPATAVERYLRAVDLDPADGRAQLHVGRLLVGLGRGDEARPFLEAALREAAGSEVAREAQQLLAALAGGAAGPGRR
jgi:arylsulfatase A-like enzyme/Tfp pilus assembly protein PilF